MCPLTMKHAGSSSTANGVVARIVSGPHDAHRQDPHLPMRYDAGRPRAVPLALAERLHQHDRPIPRGRLRAVAGDVRRPGRWDDDCRTPLPRGLVDGDRVIGGVSGDALEMALDRVEQIDAGDRIITCASRIPNALAASRIEATLRGA